MVTHVDVDILQLLRDYKTEPTVEMRNQLVEMYPAAFVGWTLWGVGRRS